ncbi:MAG: DNA polymerase IV [Planctomycetota bacterium]|nr:DNA polymerase IV [Planctomycetota bacterium]
MQVSSASPARDLMLVDLDAFYVSVERARDPALVGRPVIVGGKPSERGVVACASYEARQHGARAGMPLFQAARCCPRDTVFLHGDHRAYVEASRQVMQILGRFTPRVEPLSLDEAYLDLTGCERQAYAKGAVPGWHSWMKTAETIQRTVFEETALPISIGVGPTRTVANVASALAKPRGILEVRANEAPAFLAALPLGYLPGAGPRMRDKLARFNLETIGDLAAVPEDVLASTFGAVGVTLSRRARGLDADLDRAPIGERAPKMRTISRATSFARDTIDPDVVGGMLSYLTQRATAALREERLLAKAVGVTLRYSDFQTVETRRRFREPTACVRQILERVDAIWPKRWDRRVKLRLVGVTLYDVFAEKEHQLDLFESPGFKAARLDERLDDAVDHIRKRHGFGALVRGRATALIERVPRTPHGFRLQTPACSR